MSGLVDTTQPQQLESNSMVRFCVAPWYFLQDTKRVLVMVIFSLSQGMDDFTNK